MIKNIRLPIMTGSKFLKGAFILALTGFIVRFLGFIFKIYLSRTIDASAIGTFQLILPLVALCHAISISGIEVTLSKNISFFRAQKNRDKVISSAINSTFLSLLLGILCMFLLNIFAKPISVYFLNNKDCTVLLRVFSLSIPLTCIHSMFYSYYIGKENALFPSFSQLFEQLMRFTSVFLLSHFIKGPMLAVLATITGEVFSVILCIILYVTKRKSITMTHVQNASSEYKKILKQAFPISINRIILSIVQSLEIAFIPMMLTLYGMTTDSSLAILGIITGMALPIVLFPATLVNAVAIMLLPAVSKVRSSTKALKKYGKRALLFSLTLGLICIIFFYTVGGKIAYALFKTENIDSITRTLSLICPFVFINTTFKSILNAMGRSYHILLNNMFTETLCLFFIVFFIPKYGFNAYITGIIISQGINSVLCIFIFNKYLRQSAKCH